MVVRSAGRDFAATVTVLANPTHVTSSLVVCCQTALRATRRRVLGNIRSSSFAAARRGHPIQRGLGKPEERFGGSRLRQTRVRLGVERDRHFRRPRYRLRALEDSAGEPPELLGELFGEGVLARRGGQRNDTVELVEKGANESRVPSKLSRPDRGRPVCWNLGHIGRWRGPSKPRARRMRWLFQLQMRVCRLLGLRNPSHDARAFAEFQSGSS
jgi:hypothetical protein